MFTIITIVKADYCLMSQLLLNILSNVTLPPYPRFFVHFKHTFVTHPTKISRSSITVTPPPRDTACHPPPKKKILNVHLRQFLSISKSHIKIKGKTLHNWLCFFLSERRVLEEIAACRSYFALTLI